MTAEQRETVKKMLKHEESKDRTERMPLYEAYLELCLKTDSYPR